jgi:GWxTD domain-containing protein
VLRGRLPLAVFAAVCLLAAGDPVVANGAQKPGLPQKYLKWMDEEVVYLITPVERDVFLKLQTDRERDLLIEAFWKNRDPTPDSPPNEFKNEHYRRIDYANRIFGRSAGKPGWMTDRGRIYIILGEPNDIQRFESKSTVYPVEIWFYQNKEELGLPGGFNLVFYQKGGLGEYKIYSPAKDGPQALMTNYNGDPMDYFSAYQALREIEPTLADVSLSLIPGEGRPALGRPTLASDMLIQKVESVPRTLVEERYAQKFLQFKDIVDVEYSANYLDSDSLVKVLKDPGGSYFVHYAIEPKRLSVNEVEGKYYAPLKITGNVSTLEGTTIFQFDKTANISLGEAQLKDVNRMPFNFQDMFPLIPGTYKISVLIKNEASKEFTSLEQRILIPGETPALQMTSPILGYKTARVDARTKRLKPFQMGSVQVYAQPGRIFSKKDTLVVAFQIFGLTAAQKQTGLIRFAFTRTGEPPRVETKAVKDCASLPDILAEFPLADFVPAHYALTVSVTAERREIMAGTEEFDISHAEFIPRPWFFSKVIPESSDPIFTHVTGIQLFNAGRMEEARAYLETAFRQRPDSAETALALAKAHMALSEPVKIPPLLSRFLEPPQPPQYEIFALAGQALAQLGESAQAVQVLESAISHFGVSPSLLNAVGECYARLDRTKDALAAWDKSLQLDANQPEIKKKSDALRNKK